MEDSKKSKTKTIKDFIVLGSGLMLNLLFGMLTTPIITRLVDPEHYGNLSLFTMYAEIVMVMLGLGLDQTLVRYFYRDDSMIYRRKLLFSCCKLPVIVCASVGLTILLILSFVQLEVINISNFIGGISTTVVTAAIVLFVFCVFALLMQRYAVLVVRLQYKSFTYSVLNILQKVFYVLLTLVFIYGASSNFENDFLLLASATTYSYLLVALIGILIEKKLWNPLNLKMYDLPFPKSELYRYGAPLIVSSGIARLLQACGSTMLKYFCDDATVGIYSGAMNLVHIFAVVQTTFNTIWAPMMVEHYEKNKGDKLFYQKANQIITFILFLFGGTMLVAKDIFAVLLGEKYREAAFILPFLMFYPIMYTISETTNCGIVFMKKTHMNIWVSLSSLAVNLIACVLLIPKMGAIGAAIATALAYMTFYIARTAIANRYFKINANMGKLAIIVLCFGIYCLYASYHTFNWVMLVAYFVFCSILVILYRNVIKEGIAFTTDLIHSRRKV